MRIRFLARAAQEYTQTIDYYEQQKTGLGFDFVEAIDATLLRIAQFPDAWQRVSQNARRCLLDDFPDGIIYAVEDDIILVLSVYHLHRSPPNFL